MALEPDSNLDATLSNITDGTGIDASDVTIPLNQIIALLRGGYLKATSDSTEVGRLNDVLTVSAPLAKALANSDNNLNLTVAAMTGATDVAVGAAGAVPQPSAGDDTKYLKGDGTWDDPAGSGQSVLPGLAGGRLTASSTDPCPDSASGATLYYLPFIHNRVSLKSGAWQEYTFTSLNLDVSGLSSGMYDIFVRDNSGLELQATEWLSTTARAAIGFPVRNDGAWGAGGGLFLGSVYVDSGQVFDTDVERLIANQHNKKRRRLYVTEDDVTTSSYSGLTWRAWNGDTAANRVRCIQPFLEDTIDFTVTGLPTGNFGRIGVGENTTGANSAHITGGANGNLLSARWIDTGRVGLNILYLLEAADAGGSSVTFNYDKNDGKQHLGGIGHVWA